MQSKKQTSTKTKKKHPEDERMTLTKGQLLNIIDAAAGKKNCCPKARDFCKALKSEIRGKGKTKK